MEWIDGVPLNQLMKTAKPAGGVPLPVAVRIVMNACAGLHAAHELRDTKGNLIGLVHRDVSPQNILVTYDGVSKVVDFGVAKATAMGGSGTVAGQLKGKVSYMAPEQVRGEAIDRRVDVFALGIVLYSLTTGKHPFRRESEAATMYTIASDEAVVPPSRFLPKYPPSLEAVLLKALAKDANDRYSTASEFQRALHLCLPPGERANTDEDVGVFIRQLFGKRREESRAALAEALAQADKRGPRSLPSINPNPLTQSQRRSLSDVGVNEAALGDESKTFGILGSAQAEAAAAALADLDFPPPRRKRAFLVVTLGALLLAGGVAFALSQSSTEARPKPKPPAEALKPIVTATPTVEASADLAPPPPPADSASAEPSGSARGLAPIVPRAASATPKVSPQVPVITQPPPVVKPKPPASKWREEPGF
jgi:eukaryotic-like serine/threonine-protein kinase